MYFNYDYHAFPQKDNSSGISWWAVLLVEGTGTSGENHQPVEVTDKLYHIMLYTSL